MNLRKVMGLAAFLAICTASYSESNFSLFITFLSYLCSGEYSAPTIEFN